MVQPKLSDVVNWDSFREEVIEVFRAALRSLAGEAELPRTETKINLRLLRFALAAHLNRIKAAGGSLPFSILFNSTNQPLPDEEADDPRLFKMPDFDCVMKDAQNPEPMLSQVHYYIECKRLGQPEKSWVFNANYSAHGIKRFADPNWGYGKGCAHGTMIGYLQNMSPADVLAEVNVGATSHGLPLLLVVGEWRERGVNDLAQASLRRAFNPKTFGLSHLWVDVRHCGQGDDTAGQSKGGRAVQKRPKPPPAANRAKGNGPRRKAGRKPGQS